MLNAKKVKIWMLFCLFLAGIADCCAQSSVVHKGNSLYKEGKFAEAGRQYDSAIKDAEAEPMIAEFNRANVHYKLGQFDNAMELYKKLAAQSENSALAQKAKYNLATSYLSKAADPNQQAPDLKKTLEDVYKSVDYYRSVLDADPVNKAAANNIEIAKFTADKIRRMMEQQKQNQQQNQDKNNEQNKDEQEQDKKQDKSSDKDKDQQQENQADPNQQDKQDKEDKQAEAEQQVDKQEQIEADAQQIIDREKQGQKIKAKIKGGHRKVEKDW